MCLFCIWIGSKNVERDGASVLLCSPCLLTGVVFIRRPHPGLENTGYNNVVSATLRGNPISS